MAKLKFRINHILLLLYSLILCIPLYSQKSPLDLLSVDSLSVEKKKEAFCWLLASKLTARLNKNDPIKSVIPNANSIDENIKKKNDNERSDNESIKKLIFSTKLYKRIHRISAVSSIDRKFKLFRVKEEAIIKKTRTKNSISEKNIIFN